jgi:glycerol-3-phosphate dehydrogenase
MNRTQAIAQSQRQVFDVCIIGGGATGAGCALDAQSRGLSTILIEKEDFGSATSSKSTKLIHGGVRYLEQAVKKLSVGQYRMVQKALKERRILLKLAPHATRPLQLLTPCRSLAEALYYFAGLKLYDSISGRSSMGRSLLLNRRQALERIPTLHKSSLHSAVLYYDGQLDDLRFNLALVQTAAEQGAVCINHLEAIAFEKDDSGKLTTAMATDRLSGATVAISARHFVNAAGPFADGIRLLANPGLNTRIRVSRGVHIVLPKEMLPGQTALLIPKTHDGRLLFALPYQQHILAGTTDDAAGLTDQPFGPTTEEVEYLLQYLNDYLDIQATTKDVVSGFGGLRPLVQAQTGHTKDLVRDHEVETDTSTGLISILGGKWTTYRLMAQDAIDTVCMLAGKNLPCATNRLMLTGSRRYDHTTAIMLQQRSGWDHSVVKHLVSKYGDQCLAVAAIAQASNNLKDRLLPGMPFTKAELQYVVQHEMACTVADVIARRWGVELANWQQAYQLAAPVAAAMAPLLHWSAQQQEQQVNAYRQRLQQVMTG